jgi:GNAT superfamily N-acetyltransferase
MLEHVSVPLTIRRARPEEAESLRELTRRSMAHWPQSPEYRAEANRLVSLSAVDLDRDEAWVAELDGVTVGYYRLSVEGDVAEIEEMFVDPPRIGQGIGRRLFEHVLASARRSGVRRLEWDTDANAAGFYLAMGGQPLGTSPSGIAGDPLTRMRITL